MGKIQFQHETEKHHAIWLANLHRIAPFGEKMQMAEYLTG
jgi:hypothetical protein